MTRTILIGDIHGCPDELDDLLREVRFTPEDRLVLVGDLVAKGPDSGAIVARARELGALAVRGNHDERCLTWYRADRDGRSLDRPLGRGHKAACAQLSDEDFAWLDALPLSLSFDELGVFVCHAAVDARAPLDDQDPITLMNGRSVRDDGRVSTRVNEGVPWATRWAGPERIVFGHDAIRGLQREAFATGLDTGCVYGGRLTALILPEDRLVSVPARRCYKPVG